MVGSREDRQVNIPTIAVLCKQLGYSGSGENDKTSGQTESRLRDTTQGWRKDYVTSDGRKGTALRDWKSEKGRADIEMMTSDYLKSGHGERFWPSGGESQDNTKLRYPQQKAEILKLLMMLFWRQNYYNNHNSRNAMSTERSKEPEDLTRSQTSSTIDLSNYSSGAANSVFNIFSSQENNTEQRRSTQTFKNVASNKTRTGLTTAPRNPDILPGISQDSDCTWQPSDNNILASNIAKPPANALNSVDDIWERSNVAELGEVDNAKSPNRIPRKKSPKLKRNTSSAKKSRYKPLIVPANVEGRPRKRQKQYDNARSISSSSSDHESDQEKLGVPLRQSERQPQPRRRPDMVPSDILSDMESELDPPSPSPISAAVTTQFRKPPLGNFNDRYRISFKIPKDPAASVSAMDSELPPVVPPEQTASGVSEQIAPTTSNDLQHTFTRDQLGTSERTCNPAPVAMMTSFQDINAIPYPPTTIWPQNSTSPELNDAYDLLINRQTRFSTTASPRSGASQVMTSPEPIPETKQRVEVEFWVVTAHQPFLEQQRWTEGMLSGKTLEFFMDAAARITKNNKIERLQCMLQTAEERFKDSVARDDEKAFELMKTSFKDEIKMAWSKNQNCKKNFRVRIDPVYAEDIAAGGDGYIGGAELADF